MGNCMRISLKKLTYIVYFIALASVFSLIYYGGYYYAINYMKSDNLVTIEEAASSNPGINNDTSFVGQVNEQIVSSDAKYVEECYNTDTEALTKTENKIPVEHIGFTREQVIDYLTTYAEKNSDPTLTNIQLVSFSADSIVIRKTICNPTNLYSYFVISENNIIKIYNSNRDSLFIDTGIDISNFEEEYKLELTDGFYIEIIHDLYNYLECITS